MSAIEDQLRSVVLDALRVKPRPGRKIEADSFFHVAGDLATIAKTRNLKTRDGHNAWTTDAPPRPNPNLIGPIRDIIWDLVVEGIVRPGRNAEQNLEGCNLPYLHVTDYGKKVLSELVTPHDPDGYVDQIRQLVPNVDPIIEKYIAESASTLRFNCLLSSTITLGVASEQAFLLLLEAYRLALTTAKAQTFAEKVSSKRMVSHKYDEFIPRFNNTLKPELKKDSSLPSDWLTKVEMALQFHFENFRQARNDAGHPTGNGLSRHVVHGHLVMFPEYLRTIYDLMEWLNARPGTL